MVDSAQEREPGAAPEEDEPQPRMHRLRLGAVLLFSAYRDGALEEPPRPVIDITDRHYTVLVHASRNGSPEARIVCADTPAAALAKTPGALLAAAVPDRLLPPHSGTPAAIALEDTVLVRASRAIIRVLFSVPPSDTTGESAAPAEDVVVATVRGILREQRPAVIRAAEGDEVDHRVWTLIADHHSDPSFDVDTIARELAFSRRQLYRRVSGEDGVAGLIAQHRLATAMRLISEDPSRPLAEVASLAGFSRLANMRALFTARVGMTPTSYRQSILGYRS
ncbi:AraC family transcriptional regulator [Microbacterium caowuchunii]|uniref:AraC family transcriptional regulator n=1 Tax=Microbacterium caowuchunii TaxID=2614638 RepID=A0A5N0T541_9MICO|nr:helix-turn-helix domain-containing protein [Microbacterium caowuchunii]KAA9129951.1 AraC family transcriptional regulator [Microbacterium caowuchunii]